VIPQAAVEQRLSPISWADASDVASIDPPIVTRQSPHRCGKRRTMAMTSPGERFLQSLTSS
jgi:hypothetical protein